MTGDFGVEERLKFFRQIDHMNKELQNARRLEKVAWDKEKKFSGQCILMSKRLTALEKGLTEIPHAYDHGLEKYVTDLKADLFELQQASARTTKTARILPPWRDRAATTSDVASSVTELDTPPGALTPTDSRCKTFSHSMTAFELSAPPSLESLGRSPADNCIESTPSLSKASDQPMTPQTPTIPTRRPHTPPKLPKPPDELGADASRAAKSTIVGIERCESLTADANALNNSGENVSETKGQEAAPKGENSVENTGRSHHQKLVAQPGPELSVIKEHSSARNSTLGRIASTAWRGLDSSLWENESRCEACDVRFLLYRRHHCRKCGRCVCSKCSPYRIPIQPTLSRQSRARSSDARVTADAATSSPITPRNLFAHRVCKLCI